VQRASVERILKKPPAVRLQRRASFFYCDRSTITRSDGALVIEDAERAVEVPASTLTALLLGPGTNISQNAIALLAEAGCMVAWTGEDGVRFYAFGTSGAESARNAIVQAQMCTNEYKRMIVAKRMLRLRFGWDLSEIRSLRQVRGREGAAVKRVYQQCAEEYGVIWRGRRPRNTDWSSLDSPNRALSAANACLNSLAHAAVLTSATSLPSGLSIPVSASASSMTYRTSISTAYRSQLRFEKQRMAMNNWKGGCAWRCVTRFGSLVSWVRSCRIWRRFSNPSTRRATQRRSWPVGCPNCANGSDPIARDSAALPIGGGRGRLRGQCGRPGSRVPLAACLCTCARRSHGSPLATGATLRGSVLRRMDGPRSRRLGRLYGNPESQIAKGQAESHNWIKLIFSRAQAGKTDRLLAGGYTGFWSS
jgi:CRISPR-associated endonuclease Cas1 subtype I-E